MKYKSAPGVILTSICGNFHLVSPYFSLKINEITAFYWKLLEKGADKEELILSILDNYEINNIDLVRKDMDALLKFLLEKHMIMRCSQ